MNSCLFLDRDGVILRQPARKRVNTIWDAHFQELSLGAMAKARQSFDRIIVITNQAGIGYGYTTIKDQKEINEWMIREIENRGGRIDEIYVCPHTPEDHCDCRKPGAVLFQRAIEDFEIDVRQSYMVGDQLSDLEAALVVGVRPVLVLSGNGTRSLCELLKNDLAKNGKIIASDPLVTRDLYSFVEKDLVLPLSIYAETTPTPCQEVAHSNAQRIQAALQKYIEAVRKKMSLARTAGL